jgi:predicted TIM-barrel fold metal-dependent hydrolase
MPETPRPTDFSRTQPPREDWLALAAPELAIEPDLPIIDTHMHLWHHPTGYRYFAEDYARDIEKSGHNVEASVFVECNSMYRASGPENYRSVGETEFALGQAAIAASGKYTSSRIAAGIVGFADLTIGAELPEVLDAHIAAANSRFRGIRMRAKWDPDPVVKGAVSADAPGLYLEPEFHHGLREVASRGLLFEASIYHPQIRDVTALARAVPEAQIVVVHSGSPVGHSSYRGREKEVHGNWLRDMKDLAACPNAAIKLGGILMTLAAYDFGQTARPITSEALAKLWRPFIEPCFELFGPQRCMVSSNFPVDKAGFGFGTVWNMFKHVTRDCSADEKQAIYSATARRIYQI